MTRPSGRMWTVWLLIYVNQRLSSFGEWNRVDWEGSKLLLVPRTHQVASSLTFWALFGCFHNSFHLDGARFQKVKWLLRFGAHIEWVFIWLDPVGGQRNNKFRRFEDLCQEKKIQKQPLLLLKLRQKGSAKGSKNQCSIFGSNQEALDRRLRKSSLFTFSWKSS